MKFITKFPHLSLIASTYQYMYPCILEVLEQLHFVCWNLHRNLITVIKKNE